MIFRNMKYFFAQGIKGLTSNGLMTLASVGIVVASLVLFGVFVLFGINVNSIGEQIKEQCEINVYLPSDMDRDNVRAVGSRLENIDGVKEAKLYTKEERLQNYKEGAYSEQAEVISTLEEDNPLRDAYILSLTDIRRANDVAVAAAKVEGVEKVTNSQDLIKTIISITNTIKYVSIWLLLILAVFAVFIISNTIKLGMFSRRKEINIMKFVGATDWFIRWPFIIEGMILGLLGALMASMIVIFSYDSLFAGMQRFMGNIELAKTSTIADIIVVGFLIMGMGMGMVGSAMSIRKHLKV